MNLAEHHEGKRARRAEKAEQNHAKKLLADWAQKEARRIAQLEKTAREHHDRVREAKIREKRKKRRR